MMTQTKSKSALLIAGPTASGKSALALKLAKERDGVIINADALQVYRELRILSARPSEEELHEVPHRLYGHVSGLDSYSVAALAGRCQARNRGGMGLANKLPIITGGTGLYFMALEAGAGRGPSYCAGNPREMAEL